MDFQIAIPSKGRVREFYLQTYRKLIYRYSLEKETTVFVQTQEDLARYSSAFPLVRVVLAEVQGLAEVHEAMRQHYPVGQRLVVMHDDLTRVVRLKNSEIRRFDDVRRLFVAMFEIMEAYGLSLGGLAPTTNCLIEAQSAKKLTLDLRFIYDPLHFELNSALPVVPVTLWKHDAERSVQHYGRCGGVVRVSEYSFSTRHKPGLQRSEVDSEQAELFRNHYPHATSQIRRHKGGYTSIVLRPLPYVGPRASEASCEERAARAFHDLVGDFDVSPDLETSGGKLLALLQTRKWNLNELRTSVVPPERRASSVSKNGVQSIRANMPVFSDSFYAGEVFDACAAVLPDGFAFNYVTVNRNMCAYPHRDAGNVGLSLILFLGKFEGGALLTERGERFGEAGVLRAFDGSKAHWNERITGGTKYTVIFYNRATGCQKQGGSHAPTASPRGPARDPAEADGALVPFAKR